MSDETKRIDDGGAAFPRTSHYPTEAQDGMSLRDYFAAKAMQAALANQAMLDKIKALVHGDVAAGHEWIAEGAYLTADAMLRARKVSR
jgi:hypothetical protein